MKSCHDASGSPPEAVEEISNASLELVSVMASASVTDRAAMLEDLVRHALATGELGKQAAQSIHTFEQQRDLTATEIRMLEIIQDALHQGAVRQLG